MQKQDYINRRNLLREQVGHGIILLPGNNNVPMNYPSNTLPFRQDSNFLYFVGVDLPGLICMIDCENGTEVLFGNEPTTIDVIWSGNHASMYALASPFGIEATSPIEDLAKTIDTAINKGRKIHYLPPYPSDRKIMLASLLNHSIEQIIHGTSPELIKSVVSQRLYKSDAEVAEIEEALNITREIHVDAIKMSLPGIYEYEIVSRIFSTAKRNNIGFAYPVICTIHGEILHNETHLNKLKKGQLLLIDAGVESIMHYASDITRTTPVGGKFSSKQKEIYEIVLSTQIKTIENIRPGVPFFDMHFAAARNIAEGLKNIGLMKGNILEAIQAGAHTLFFPHGLGHAIGLDVHDMEDLGEDYVGHEINSEEGRKMGNVSIRFGRKLEPGFVVTVEPGIYFIPALIDLWQKEKKFEEYINYKNLEDYIDFGGIRIEDNILVTQTGSRILGPKIPKSVKEIEALY
jgi:Xaa-Pro aminopeptidase